MALVEAPYILLRVIVFLLAVVPILAFVIVYGLIRVVLVLPRTIVAIVSSKTSVTPGSHVAGTRGKLQEMPSGTLAGHHFDRTEGDYPVPLSSEIVSEETLARVAELWSRWQESIAKNDESIARPAMTEGFWRVHRMLLELRKKGGVQRVFDGRIVDASTISSNRSGIVDELRVRLRCEGVCYDRSNVTGMVLRGEGGAGAWSEEVWLRRIAGRVDPGRIARVPTACQNCGAPLHVSSDGSCRTCGALAAGQPTDWVLGDAWRDQW